MAEKTTLGAIDNDLKDVVQNIFDLQTDTHTYGGSQTPEQLVKRLQSLTVSLKTLQSHSVLNPHLPANSPNDPPQVKNPDDLLLNGVYIPPEVIDYVDSSRNPDIYTREFVELVQRGNQDLKGKSEAFSEFRDILAEEMTTSMPETKDEVRRVLGATGGSAA